MADDDLKVYYPETISENPLPESDQTTSPASSQDTANQEFSNETIKENDFPTKRIAHELLGESLNTKSRRILAEFQFTLSGALQIGKYENGTSGDIRISPNGIVARDQTGAVTFALDGTTGDAVFKGTVQTGTLISGTVVVGNNNVIIDGENKRIMIYDESGTPRILLGYQLNGF